MEDIERMQLVKWIFEDKLDEVSDFLYREIGAQIADEIDTYEPANRLEVDLIEAGRTASAVIAYRQRTGMSIRRSKAKIEQTRDELEQQREF